VPYETSTARLSVYGIVEAGTSTQMPPSTLYGPPQITQPTGGIPEMTADAEQNSTTTEEEESPVSDFYCSRIPRVTDRLFGVRHPKPETPTVSGPRRISASCEHGRKHTGVRETPKPQRRDNR